MELDQLRYFLKVAERGNFTRAAEELLISQPALSRSIQRLEEELGQPVFERLTRTLRLTAAGKLLQARAKQALALLDDTKIEIADDGQSGTVRVGAIPTIAPYYLPRLLQQFADAYPRSSVVVQENTTERLLKSLAMGEVDVAAVALPIEDKHLHVESLFEEELLLVLPLEHPLNAKERISLKDVEPYPFVLLDEAHCLSDNIVSICRQRAFQPVAVERTSQLTMVQELVSLGHGVSMVPAMARSVDTSQRRVYRRLMRPIPKRTVAMATNPYRYQCRILGAFLELMKRTQPQACASIG